MYGPWEEKATVLDVENDFSIDLIENKSGNETTINLSPQRFRYGPVHKENSICRTPSTPRLEKENGDYKSQRSLFQ